MALLGDRVAFERMDNIYIILIFTYMTDYKSCFRYFVWIMLIEVDTLWGYCPRNLLINVLVYHFT